MVPLAGMKRILQRPSGGSIAPALNANPGLFGRLFWPGVRVGNCTKNRFAMRANNYEARHHGPITNQVVSQLNRHCPLACWAFPAAHRRSPSPPRPSPQILVTQYRRQEQLTFGNRDKFPGASGSVYMIAVETTANSNAEGGSVDYRLVTIGRCC